MLTKQQEVELIRKFAAGLPAGSYLATMFKDIVPEVEGMIANDFAYSPIAALRKTQYELSCDIEGTRKTVAEVQQRHDILKAEVRNLERTKTYLKGELDELGQRAARLASHAKG